MIWECQGRRKVFGPVASVSQGTERRSPRLVLHDSEHKRHLWRQESGQGPDQAMTYKVRAIDRSEVQCKTTGDCEGRERRVSPYRYCQEGEQQQASTTTSLERGLTQTGSSGSKRNSKAKRQMRKDARGRCWLRNALWIWHHWLGFPSALRGALPYQHSAHPS